MKKSKWERPVINRIKLDPKQAGLAACVVGGVYFSGGMPGVEEITACMTNDPNRPHALGGVPPMACTQDPVEDEYVQQLELEILEYGELVDMTS